MGRFRKNSYYKYRTCGVQAGMTFIELMVVLVISSLTIAIGALNVPVMMNSFDRQHARQQFEFDVSRARNEALSEGTRGVISIATDGASYSFGLDYLPYNSPAAADTSLFERLLPTDITISSDQTIIFSSRGYLTDSGGDLTSTNIVLSSGGHQFLNGTIYSTGTIDYD